MAVLIVIAILLVIVISGIKIVPQTQAYVIERLGAYHKTWQTGIHFCIPILERIAKKASLKEQVVDFAPQPVITKDNVTMQIDTVVFYQITDAKLYAYGVESPILAIENLTATTLRNIIGELELDQTLTSRDTINAKIRSILDEATDPWGIKINRVELKNIKPPAEIQDAMEKQMKAERQRREAILRAEGEKASAILVAEGKKASQILEAEAEKAASILRAEAEKEAAILRAEAEKEAILRVNEAQAEAIRMINEANPTEAYLTLKKMDAMIKVGDGQATKIIIPSELQGVVGLVNTITESK
ncbi:MAG: SPFH/Band 7/PHB domain protein [Clostridia bacterium]|nr:SPFH/Band 7/PHB domain protein [Clostridia bacterium]